MRTWMWSAAALCAVSSAAGAADAGWGAFTAGTGFGVGVQGPDKTQLMFKCDKPGPGSVFAVLARPEQLVPPSPDPVMRDVRVRLDDKAPYDDRWRFLENTAMAVNKGNERSLARLMTDIGKAQTLELLIHNDPKQHIPMTVTIPVGGAQVALEHVFTSCKDTLPKL